MPIRFDVSRHERYKRQVVLLNDWAAAPGEYDERVWPAIDEELQDSGLVCQDDEITSYFSH